MNTLKIKVGDVIYSPIPYHSGNKKKECLTSYEVVKLEVVKVEPKSFYVNYKINNEIKFCKIWKRDYNPLFDNCEIRVWKKLMFRHSKGHKDIEDINIINKAKRRIKKLEIMKK